MSETPLQATQPLKIGIAGLGTVGSGLVNLLHANRQVIESKIGRPIEVTVVGARRDNPLCEVKDLPVTRAVEEVLDADIDVFVELIGGTSLAKTLVEKALVSGKHVVTANKALIAEHGQALFALAKKHQREIRCEAAVAGGIPVLKAINEGLVGNDIAKVSGIINGTGNFILTAMAQEQRPFEDVLSEAQALGYAEADPTFDVEGIDAAHKLTILASLAFGIPLSMDQVYVEGIRDIQVADLEYAKQAGFVVKHLGIASKQDGAVALRVHPTLVSEKKLLAKVDGVMNAVMVESDALGESLYYGAGAGALPTASAVVADIVDLASDRPSRSLGFAQEQTLACLPIESVLTAYYLRLDLQSGPGVLAKVTAAFSEFDVSIHAIHQQQEQDADSQAEQGKVKVPVVILTQPTREACLAKVLDLLASLDEVAQPVVRIRAELS